MGSEELQCEEVGRWISKSVDSELSVKEVGEMRRHLEGCTACHALAEDSRDMKAWFVPTDPVPVPAGFAQRVVAEAFAGKKPIPSLHRLAGGPQVLDEPVAPHREDRFIFRMTAVAAALLVMLGLALSMQRLNESRDLKADTDSKEDVLKGLEALNEGRPAFGLSKEDAKSTEGPSKEDSNK